MPKPFLDCIKAGGKVVTKSYGPTYQHFCIKGGKVYPGEIKKSKEASHEG